MQEPVRVYVGSDRSQLLAVKVLAHSIKRHTQLPVEVRSLHDVVLPMPAKASDGPKTGFSFARFAIPELAGFKGRAIYMDADMLVFRDISELWDLPMGDAAVALQEELPEDFAKHSQREGGKRRKQTAVMLLDCARLDWRAPEIIAGLGVCYNYEELVHQLCILRPEQIRYAVPLEWNSMEYYDPARTCLIHYTDMFTQPWVNPDNPFGYLWLDEVRMMLNNGALSEMELREEVALGYFRPSLLVELGLEKSDGSQTLRKLDRRLGYVAHRDVYRRNHPYAFSLVEKFGCTQMIEKLFYARRLLRRVTGKLRA